MQSLALNIPVYTPEQAAPSQLKFDFGPSVQSSRLLTREDMAIWTGLVSRGIANALRGLSEMVGHQIVVTSLDLKWLPAKDASGMLGRSEAVGVGIYLGIEGDATGHLLLMHDINIAFKLIDIQLGLPLGTTDQLGEMERSVLGEMGNITGSFFLNALADSGNMILMPSPPAVITDLASAIMNIPLTFLMQKQDDALVVKATFSADNQPLDGTFVVLPTMEFMMTILSRQIQ